MTRRFTRCLMILMAGLLAGQTLRAAGTNTSAAFKEVFDLARKELPGLAEPELDTFAAQGLIAQLIARGMVAPDPEAASSSPCVETSRAFDDSYAYVRFARVGPGAAGEFQKALTDLGGKEKLKGLVVDLRFANGQDYAAAAEVADLFIGKAQTLFNVGEGMFRSHEKANAIGLHTAVLVNGQTSIAAEALAAVLHEAGAGLLIGDATAGRARMWRPFTLSDGTRLLLAGGAVKLGSGNEIPAGGVIPDIAVKLRPDVEKKFLSDPFYEADAGTNGRTTVRKRTSEAQLLRERNGSAAETDAGAAGQKEEKPAPVVRDPALSRALDLLKGLFVVRPVRPS